MSATEKAKDLIEKMYKVHSLAASDITWYFAKQCALIAVDEMIIQNNELYLKGLAEDYYIDKKNFYLFDVKEVLQSL